MKKHVKQALPWEEPPSQYQTPCLRQIAFVYCGDCILRVDIDDAVGMDWPDHQAVGILAHKRRSLQIL